MGAQDYTTICSSAPSEVLALMGLRGREAIVEKNLRTMRSNLTLLDDFFDQHADEFTYYPPQGATVVFPELTVGRSGAWPVSSRGRSGSGSGATVWVGCAFQLSTFLLHRGCSHPSHPVNCRRWSHVDDNHTGTTGRPPPV